MHAMSYCVLVLDSDGNVRTLLKLALDQQGHQLLVTPDSDSNVALAQIEQPDIILLDVDAAHRNEQVVYLDLQRNPQTRTIPVLVLSTAFTPEELARWRRMPNVVDVILKPFEITVLLAYIDAICEARLAGNIST